VAVLSPIKEVVELAVSKTSKYTPTQTMHSCRRSIALVDTHTAQGMATMLPTVILIEKQGTVYKINLSSNNENTKTQHQHSLSWQQQQQQQQQNTLEKFIYHE
jgi:hypothetical protein